MAELNDIQLRIIVQGMGLEQLQRTSDGMGRLAAGVQNASKQAAAAKGVWTNFADGLSNLERRFDAVFRAASHLQALGRDLTGMGMAGMGFLKSAVDEWGNFEFALNRAAGALEIFDTQTPIYHKLQNAINDVAQEVRVFPAEDVAMAMYVWGSATGQVVESQEDLNTLVGAVTPLLKAAAVTQTGYEVAIKGVYSILQQYNMGLEDAGEVTAKLMLSSQKTALEFGNLIEAFKMTGPVAAAAGATFDDMVTFMGMIGDAGIRGSQSGRALRQTFIKLVKPTARATEALDAMVKEQLGLNTSWQELVFPEGKFIGMKGYFDLLAKGTKDMTDEQRGFLLATITTANELPVMTAVVNRQIDALKEGKNAWDDQKYALAGAQEQFDGMFNLLKNSWKGVLGGITNTIGPIVRLVGSAVARMAAPFLEKFALMLDSVYNFLDTHPELVDWGVKLLAIASAALIVAGAVFTAVGVLLAFGAGIAFVVKGAALFINTFPRFFPILGALIAIVTAIATNFGGLRDAIANVIGAFINLFQAMSFEADTGSFNIMAQLMPILESGAKAVAGALNLLADMLNWVAQNRTATIVVQNLVQALGILLAMGAVGRIMKIGFSLLTLGGNASQAVQGVRFLIDEMIRFGSLKSIRHPIRAIKDFGAAIKIAGEGMKTTFTNNASKAKQAIEGIGGAAASAKGTTLRSFGGLAAGIARLAPLIGASMTIMMGPVGIIIAAIGLLAAAWVTNFGGIQEKTAAVVDWIVARFNEFATWIGSVWATITQTISDAVTNIVNFFRDLPTNIGNFLTDLWTTVTTKVGEIVTAIIEFPGKAWAGLTGAIAEFFANYNAWWDSMGVETNERLGFILGYVWTWMGNMIAAFIEWAGSVWNTIVKWADDTLKAFGDWVVSVWNTITTWFTKLPGHIMNFLTTIWNNFTTWFGNTLRSFTAWITSVVNTVTTWISKLPGRIMQWLSDVWNKVSAWFSKFISDAGIWASRTIEKVIEFIKKLPGRIMEWMGTTYRDVHRWWTVDFIPNIGTWAADAIKKVVQWFQKLPGQIIEKVGFLIGRLRTFFSELPGKIIGLVKAVGTSIINGIKQGISDAWNGLVNWFSGLFSGLKKGADAANDAHSPSRLYMGLGKDIIDGLRIGIEKNNTAAQAMNDQVHNILDTARQLRSESLGELGSDFGFSAESERRLVVEMRVSSPDGTVNKASRDQIREIFTAEELVSSLEHMATVG